MGASDPIDSVERLDCSAVYIDDRVQLERWVFRDQLDPSRAAGEPDSLHSDVQLLLGICKQIYLCHAGTSFATKLAELNEYSGSDCTPVFAFFDIEPDGEESVPARRKISRTSSFEISPSSPASLRHGFTFASQSADPYGLQLLSSVSADIQVQEAPNIIIPIAFVRSTGYGMANGNGILRDGRLSSEHLQITKCLDAGAVDILIMPLNKLRVEGLLVHAYRTRKMAQREMTRFLARRKLRKHSWVGAYDEQPYAYLREAMVSKLMKGICNPEDVIKEFQDRELDINPHRKEFVKEHIARWDFAAQKFSEDELVFGACTILQHALDMPELERWRLTPFELRVFVLASRAAYNSFVLYHNFRHAVDVLQSTFCFLIRIGAVPPYGPANEGSFEKSPIASILSPFHSLTILISAIGHDVGHPGVNNIFLVKLNAPLAQLYNDNSVLEAFHCAAFSQILRRHWPSAFKDKQLRKLLISSILATDMGVHQKFMQRLGQLQEKFYENGKTLDGWKLQDIEIYRTLICGLLIKCADISNVARPWPVAERWTKVLQEEFANQGEMEKEIGMETALLGGPPELGNVYKLATGQIGFMSMFAIPLFEGVSDLLPQMEFTVERIRRNQFKWTQLANFEKRKQSLHVGMYGDNTPSPRTQSPSPEVHTNKHRDFTSSISAPARGAESNEPGDKHEPVVVTDCSSRNTHEDDTIGRAISIDTRSPPINVRYSPYLVETPKREISCDIPDLTMTSFDNAHGPTCPAAAGNPVEASRPSSDHAVLAAVIFANAAKDEHDHQVHSVTDNCTGTDPGRPSSSRNGPPRYHDPASCITEQCLQRGNPVWTQNGAAYSNSTVPISPVTHTASLAADGGDKGAHRDNLSMGELEPNENDSTAANHISRQVDNMGKSSITATVVRNGTTSPPQSATSGGGGMNESTESTGVDQSPVRLAKRRSRIRLAFWRRKSHHSHQQEVGGET